MEESSSTTQSTQRSEQSNIDRLEEISEIIASAAPKTSDAPRPSLEPSVTAAIDSVDPMERIAQLNKLKAEMEKNFDAMKRAYGGGKKPAASSKCMDDGKDEV